MATRQAKGLQVASINRELQVLRRLLHLAAEWGFVEQVPKVRMLSGERHREFVLSPDEEGKYLGYSFRAFSFRGNGIGRHRNATGGVLPPPMGVRDLGQWSLWHATGDTRKDSRCAPTATNDS